MVKLTKSLRHWLSENHKDVFPLIAMGHIELFTKEMNEKYVEWCKTDEGKEYLQGGKHYEEPK